MCVCVGGMNELKGDFFVCFKPSYCFITYSVIFVRTLSLRDGSGSFSKETVVHRVLFL